MIKNSCIYIVNVIHNLSQLVGLLSTVTKIDPNQAKEVLDTNIRELLPTQQTRQQEINKHWGIYIKTVALLKKAYPNLLVIIAKSDNVAFPKEDKSFKIEKNAKKAIIASDIAIVASGTATLECAIEGTPLVVCYKVSTLTWLLAKLLVKVEHSSIVNLIAGKKIVPEFLQSEMKPYIIKNKLIELIDEKSKLRNQMMEDFLTIKDKLGTPGVYAKIANEIFKATKT